MFHILLTLLYVNGLDGFMIIIYVMDESCECAVGIIDIFLALPLEVLLVQ